MVGVAQRRTRAGARFQCALVDRWDPVAIAGLLALPPGRRAALVADLGSAAIGLEVDPADAVDALQRSLAAR